MAAYFAFLHHELAVINWQYIDNALYIRTCECRHVDGIYSGKESFEKEAFLDTNSLAWCGIFPRWAEVNCRSAEVIGWGRLTYILSTTCQSPSLAFSVMIGSIPCTWKRIKNGFQMHFERLTCFTPLTITMGTLERCSGTFSENLTAFSHLGSTTETITSVSVSIPCSSSYWILTSAAKNFKMYC